MAEQYIYSRSDKGFVNARGQEVALGFGFVAFSPGMGKALKDAVNVHSKDCPQLEDTRLPLLRKACLPKGQTLLQKSTWVRDGDRGFHVAHGYILEPQEARAAGPAGWLAVPFRLENPNLTEGGILLDSLPGLTAEGPFQARALGETMECLGLDRQSFCQLLLACFDAVAAHTQLLIAYDFQAFQGRDLRASILYWIYTLLPRELWPSLSFDSVYTEISTPGQVQLAFVERGQLQTEEKYPGIQLGTQPVALGSRFLVLDGRIIHNENKSKPVWYGREGIYARWLEQAADALWTCPEETARGIVRGVDEFYEKFRQQLDAARPEEESLPKWYDAVCERSLDFGPPSLETVCAGVRESVPENQHIGSRLLLGDLLETAERREILEYILREKHRAPMGEKEAEILRRLVGPDEALKQDVGALLGAFMAEETDKLGSSAVQVIERYSELMPGEVSSIGRQRLLSGAPDERELEFWTRCGVDGGEEAAEGRRKAWYAEMLPGQERVWEMPSRIGPVLARLGDGFRLRQVARLWQEPFRAQCEGISRKNLRELADRELPEKLRKLERGLAELPGGVPEEALGLLEIRACDLLLEEPAAFMNAEWLGRMLNVCRFRGETRETLALLREFMAGAQGNREDIKIWVDCRKRHPMAREHAFGLLPNLYLAGALPNVGSGLVLSFLHQVPEKRRELVLQAARLGGGSLLMDILYRSRRYERPLGRGDMTDLLAVVRCVSEDGKVLELAEAEREGFTGELEGFLNSQKTRQTLSAGDISRALESVREKSKRTMGRRQRAR